jgi:murein L,D-transpeptidase YcbB/YkuD
MTLNIASLIQRAANGDVTVLKDLEDHFTQKAVEAVLRVLPNVLKQLMEHGAHAQQQLDSFYEKNADMRGQKQQLARITQLVETEHPEYSMEQVLTEASRRLRNGHTISRQTNAGPKPGRKELDGRFNGVF